MTKPHDNYCLKTHSNATAEDLRFVAVCTLCNRQQWLAIYARIPGNWQHSIYVSFNYILTTFIWLTGVLQPMRCKPVFRHAPMGSSIAAKFWNKHACQQLYSTIWNHFSFYKVWSQSFKFQSLFTIHNLFSFSLCIIHLKSFQLSLFTVFSSFQFSVNSKQLVSHLILIQVMHRLTMELLPASYCFRFNVFFYGSLNSLNCSECVWFQMKKKSFFPATRCPHALSKLSPGTYFFIFLYRLVLQSTSRPVSPLGN